VPDKPRLLVLAEAANPEWVSVPLVGWSLAHALREVAQVHLVTQIRNRDAILRAGYREGADFTAIDSEAVARPLFRAGEILRGGKPGGWTTAAAAAALGYPYFERLVWRRFGPAIRGGRYDVVHRITPLSPTAQSPIAAKVQAAGVPFVLGPLNGGVPWPPAFAAERRREREWLAPVRGVYRAMPGRRASLAAAAAVLAGSRHTMSELPRPVQARAVWLPENGIDPDRFDLDAPAVPRSDGAPLRACFVGRLVPYKGPDMALEAALPLLAAGKLRLDIVGDGPLMAQLRARVAAAGVGAAVVFHGWAEHGQVHAVMRDCDVLAFPSIREFGGGVVLEAMASGCVPLVVDYAGPGELVTPATGVALPLGERADIVASLGAALARFARAPETLAPLAAAGRAVVTRHFTWAAKARQVAQTYDWALKRRRDRPDFSAVTAPPDGP
jgi:glycosyltransferase involved in cell wall biosynthesis